MSGQDALQGTPNTLATGHAVHKRAGGEHNTISNDSLKTATQVGDKPVKDCNTIGCLKPFQQHRMVQSAKSSTPDQAEPPGKLVSHPRYKANHQGHSVRQSLRYGFACKETERFQADDFSAESGQLSQESFR